MKMKILILFLPILVSSSQNDQCIESLKDVLGKVQELEAIIKSFIPEESQVEERRNLTAIKGVFEGSIIKSDPDLVLPTSVQINWFNQIENPKTAPPDYGTLWNMITTSQVINSDSFKIELETSIEEMNENITLHSKILEGIREDFGIDLTDFRLAMGLITGHYGGIQGNIYDPAFWQNLIQGPNNEMAFADIYAVFYKQGTGPWKALDIPECNWLNQIPDGFSCAKATSVNSECNRRGRKHDGFVQIPCNEIVLKVTTKVCDPPIKKYPDPIENWDQPNCLINFKYN